GVLAWRKRSTCPPAAVPEKAPSPVKDPSESVSSHFPERVAPVWPRSRRTFPAAAAPLGSRSAPLKMPGRGTSSLEGCVGPPHAHTPARSTTPRRCFIVETPGPTRASYVPIVACAWAAPAVLFRVHRVVPGGQSLSATLQAQRAPARDRLRRRLQPV